MNNQEQIKLIESKIEELKKEVEKLKEPEDKNAFVQNARRFEGHLEDMSKMLFGSRYTLQLISDSTPKDRPELDKRAFIVHEMYKVELIPTHTGRTCITIFKK
jgi:hypothetical protein